MLSRRLDHWVAPPEHLESRQMLAGHSEGIFGANFEPLGPGNTEAIAPQIHAGTQIGDHFYLLAHDGTGDVEVWRSDGTQNGTERFVEFDANWPQDGHFWRCCQIAGIGDRLYTVIERLAPDVNRQFWHGQNELWTSDGTDEGTQALANLGDAYRESRVWSHLMEQHGQLLMQSEWYSDGSDERIWTSDGTPDGTNFYFSHGTAYVSAIQELVNFNNRYFFLGLRYGAVGEVFGLWETDPSSQSTSLVATFEGDEILGKSPSQLTVSGGLMYFTADLGDGDELFRSDGTATGTFQVRDIQPGPEGSMPRSLTHTPDGLVFLANDGTGENLWTSDGTEAGTQPYQGGRDYQSYQILPWGKNGKAHSQLRDYPANYEAGDLILHFNASGLWAANRETDLTQLLAQTPAPDVVGLFNGQAMLSEGASVFSVAADELELAPRFQLPSNTLGSDPVGLTPVGEQLFVISESSGSAMWIDQAGEIVMRFPDDDLLVYDRSGDLLTDAVTYNEELYVLGQRGLMKWDADSARWQVLIANEVSATQDPPVSPVDIRLHADDDGVYYVTGEQEATSAVLWKTEGTPESTQIIGDLPHANWRNFGRMNVSSLAGRFYYTEDHLASTLRSFDTRDGTMQFTDLDTQVRSMGPHGESLYIGDTSGNLWRTTNESGLQLVRAFTARPNDCCNADPRLDNFTSAGDFMFFTVDDGVHGNELWVTDGTFEGTQLAADVRPGRNSSAPSHLAVMDDALVFAANDGQSGRELWKLSLAVDELLGDANGNDVVDFADFLILSAYFGQNSTNGASEGDLDANGTVDFDDFLLLAENFGKRK